MEALAGLFRAGYIGLPGPVIGLGVLTLVAPLQVSLLVFAGFPAAAAVAVAPVLLHCPDGSRPDPGVVAAERPERTALDRGGPYRTNGTLVR